MDREAFTRELVRSRHDPGNLARLFDLVYDELIGISRRQLRSVGALHTLNTTELINEAFVRMVDGDSASMEDRAHFCAYAARAMRAILVDRARRRMARKRGGGVIPDTFRDDLSGRAPDDPAMLIDVHDALSGLEAVNERLARVVECRFFGGMTIDETASALGMTDRTVRRDWLKAKAWLNDELHDA